MCFPEDLCQGTRSYMLSKVIFKASFTLFILFVLASVVCDYCELKTTETWGSRETSAPP